MTQKSKENLSVTKKFSYKEQHAVIVRCDSEKEQEAIFEKLKNLGFNNLKLVSV